MKKSRTKAIIVRSRQIGAGGTMFRGCIQQLLSSALERAMLFPEIEIEIAIRNGDKSVFDFSARIKGFVPFDNPQAGENRTANLKMERD